MKKFFVTLITAIFLLSNASITYAQKDLFNIATENYSGLQEKYRPKSALLFDVDSGEILFSENMDLEIPPASLTKIMTTFIVYNAIKNGTISYETKIKATKRYEEMSKITGLTTSKIVDGEEYTVYELLAMNLLPSSNVASIMLGEYLGGGSYDNFVTQMNNVAKELNMTNTHFNNISGVENQAYKNLVLSNIYSNTETNTSSAKDLALLTKTLLKQHKEVLEITQLSSINLKQGRIDNQIIKNTNKSLPNGAFPFNYGVVDGLKTGSSPNANFNIILTATQDDRRLCAIILSAGKWENQKSSIYRNIFANSLLKYGFENFEKKTILNYGRHKINGTEVDISEDLILTLPKNNNQDIPNITLENNKIKSEIQLDTISNEKIFVEYKEVTIKQKIIEKLQRAYKKQPLLLYILPITIFLFIFVVFLLLKKEK